jgi:hypothetical protein
MKKLQSIQNFDTYKNSIIPNTQLRQVLGGSNDRCTTYQDTSTGQKHCSDEVVTYYVDGSSVGTTTNKCCQW